MRVCGNWYENYDDWKVRSEALVVVMKFEMTGPLGIGLKGWGPGASCRVRLEW